MPYEKGGRADKSGNRYEIHWVVYQMLRVLEEKIKYIVLEATGDDEKGIDVWVGQNNGIREGQQCKGRNGEKEYWDYGSINARGIIQNWKIQLDSDETKTVSLVSPLAFTVLQDLIDRANSSGGNPKNFYSGQILTSGRKFNAFFSNFCNGMKLNKEDDIDISKCISYLKRISYHQFSNESLKEFILDKIRYLLIGNEIEISDLFISWVVGGTILGKEINYSEICRFLDSHDINLRNLALDKRVQPRISELNKEFESRFSKIDNKLIIRDEFSECRKTIESGESAIIYGKAGRGKSGCTVDIVDYCQRKSIPHLAIKLDNHIPNGTAETWAQQIGLPSSIPNCMHSISGNQPAVIILDQLDALRWTQNHSRESLTICEQIIDQVTKLNTERKHNISIIFICRSYDLENDNNIKSLFRESDEKRNSIIWNRIEVKDLSNEKVYSIVGEQYNQLTSKLKEVLRIPSNLYIWEQLDHGRNYVECTSTTHLVTEWWNQLSRKCHEFRLDEVELNSIKMRIVEWLEQNGRILFPLQAVNISKSYLDFLSSNSFVVIQENRGSFAHQSILDCFLAEKLSKRYYDDEDIIKIIGPQNKQTPGKRYQVQMFLEMLLEYDTKDFLKVGQLLFENNQIRFFLKFVFLEILNQIENPNDNICNFILKNCENPMYGTYLIKNVLMGKPQYVRLLRRKGILDEWLGESELRGIVYSLIESITPQYSEGDIEFIENNFLNSPNAVSKISRIFPYDLNEDSNNLFELRMLFYNEYPENVNSNIYFRKITKNSEMRVVRVLEFLLKNKEQGHSDYRNTQEIIDSDSEIFINDGREVINTLIPLIPTEGYNAFGKWSCLSSDDSNLERLCIEIIKKANRNIICSNPALFWSTYEAFMGHGYSLFNEIILDGFTYLSEQHSDRIMKYLLQDIEKNIFVLTDDSGNELTLVKKVLCKHAEYCSQDTFNELQDKIYKYLPGNALDCYKRRVEYNKQSTSKCYWSFSGELQMELLEVLPSDRINKQTNDMIGVLHRKFPNGTDRYRQNMITTESIGSPLTGKKLSNKQWLGILTNKKIKRRGGWSNDYIDNSIVGYSQSFQTAVSEDPSNFISLVIQHKELILPEYVDVLFSSVAYSKKVEEVSIELLEEMFSTFPYNYTSYRAKHICEIIQKKSNLNWSPITIERLKDIAINHENPEFSQNTLDNNEKIRDFTDLQTSAINCTKGSAAMAIAHLLWNNRPLFSNFKETIEKMTLDNEPAVQLAVCFAIWPSYNINKKWAAEQILNLYEQDYRFAGIEGTKEMLFRLYPLYRERVISIIINCYRSNDDQLAMVGAYCICEMFILKHEFEGVLEDSDSMNESQTKGILNMAILYFNKKDFNQIAKDIILRFKNSVQNSKVPLSSLFRDNLIDLDRDKTFLIEVMDSDMTHQTVYSFVHYLEQESKSVIDYKDVILSMCHKIIINRDIDDSYYISNEISKLIIGLYDETVGLDSNNIAEECLNLWDLMYKYQIGSIRSLSQQLMER